MYSALLSQASAAPLIAGGLVVLSCLLHAYLVGYTSAQLAKKLSDEKKCRSITSSLSCPSQDGTASTVLSRACFAAQMAFKCYADLVTKTNPRRKIVSDEKTQKRLNYLKTLIEEAKTREAANAIEKAANELLGEQNFVYRKEAELLAVLPADKLTELIDRILLIRIQLDDEYASATNALGEKHEDA